MGTRRQQSGQPSRQPTAPKPQGNATKIQQIKIVLLGDQGVGKSSIALRFVRGEFPENSEATIGAAFLTHTINIHSNILKFDIWDTAGQERYRSLAPMYYRGAQAAVVVYDITHQLSFEKAMSWIKELQHQASSNVVIVLAGNKADLAEDSRTVSSEDAQSYAEGNNLIFGEVSAKTGLAINDIFMAIAHRLSAVISSGGSLQRPQGIRLTADARELDSDDDGGGGGGKGCCKG